MNVESVYAYTYIDDSSAFRGILCNHMTSLLVVSTTGDIKVTII